MTILKTNTNFDRELGFLNSSPFSLAFSNCMCLIEMGKAT